MNKDITSNKLTKLLYQELNQYLTQENAKAKIISINIESNEASQIYSKMKQKIITKETIIKYENINFSKINYIELINYIKKLNNTKEVTGIMIGLPLPDYLKKYEREILDTINPSKDIDGLTTTSIKLLNEGKDSLIPCTALGIETLLKAYNINLNRKKVSIINRSNIVGKPLYSLMLKNGAIPILCHSQTTNLKKITKESDIVIAALNKPEYITKEYIKKESIIVDVGVHKNELGKIIGDVDYHDVLEKCSQITPPTNAIGPMTICMLAYNAAKCIYKEDINLLLKEVINKYRKKVE